MLPGDRDLGGGKAAHSTGGYLLFPVVFHRRHAFEATVPEAAYILTFTVLVIVTLGIIFPDAADIVRWANFFLFIW